MKKISAKLVCRTAVLAAIYVALSMLFMPISFGMFQVRVAEALTIIPAISSVGIWAVTLGCAVSNAWGVAAGVNLLGPIDIVAGASATFAAAVLSRRLRRIKIFGLPWASTIPPVIINAVVIGGELTLIESGSAFTWPLLGINMAYVGVGQFISCVVLGLGLVSALCRTGLAAKLFGHSCSESR
jgi:uncharacterized membrane protein